MRVLLGLVSVPARSLAIEMPLPRSVHPSSCPRADSMSADRAGTVDGFAHHPAGNLEEIERDRPRDRQVKGHLAPAGKRVRKYPVEPEYRGKPLSSPGLHARRDLSGLHDHLDRRVHPTTPVLERLFAARNTRAVSGGARLAGMTAMIESTAPHFHRERPELSGVPGEIVEQPPVGWPLNRTESRTLGRSKRGRRRRSSLVPEPPQLQGPVSWQGA